MGYFDNSAEQTSYDENALYVLTIVSAYAPTRVACVPIRS